MSDTCISLTFFNFQIFIRYIINSVKTCHGCCQAWQATEVVAMVIMITRAVIGTSVSQKVKELKVMNNPAVMTIEDLEMQKREFAADQLTGETGIMGKLT